MRKVRRILSNKQGSSLMIAIVVMLIVVILSAIIIVSASANVNRTNGEYEEHQAYLSAESTALLFRDLITGCTLTIENDMGTLNIKKELETSFNNMLAEDVLKLMDETTAVNEVTRTLEASAVEGLLSGEQEILITYTMNDGLGIELRIQVLKDSAIVSQLSAIFAVSRITREGVTTVTWDKGTITRPDVREGS